ncbi:hypothetical protein B0T17DRAFT_489864 [Bombardia bombarda]|uniref:Uncharacterized protein n=1 Tax=Bombardia bombarda TaxID=252184 RepID=A0AA39X8I2_9PEZI|nr:hypothetical protein B0T17DRAFT_489864 [Bombardia bombarda]
MVGGVSALLLPHFTIVFWDLGRGPPPIRANVRDLLLDDEQGDSTDVAQRARDRGINVLTTFNYTAATRTASFWLRRDVVEVLTGKSESSGRWNAYLWWTDLWTPQTSVVPAVGGLVVNEKEWPACLAQAPV